MEPSNEKPGLIRALNLKEGIAIHMGAIIGSGIFIVPATIAGRLHTMGPIMLVWILAGMLTLFGALSVAELSSIIPEAGGPYHFLKSGFGRIWGFMFSWNDYFINKGGSAAALAVAFVTYVGYFVPALSPEHAPLFSHTWVLFGHSFTFAIGWLQITAMGAIAVVTLVNILGVMFSGWVMNIFTSAKVIGLIVLILAAFLSAKGNTMNMRPWWPEQWTASMLPAFGLAMVSALWAYDGWIHVTLTAGEIKNPQRNVPLALLIGTIAIIALYLTANLAFAYIIPIDKMPGSPRIAADVARCVMGPFGAGLIVVAIMCSTFGTCNGEFLAGPRSLYAAGKDGAFAASFAKVHPKFHTPYVSIIVLSVWSMLLTLSGTFEQITAYVVFGSWWFYALTALSVIALRKKMPNAPRPFKAWGYPYLTLLFVIIAAWFLYNTIMTDGRNAVIGITLILISLPFYFFWTRPSALQEKS